MLTDGPTLSTDNRAASRSAATADILSSSARDIKSRQAAATAARKQQQAEREERDRTLASEQRKLSRRARAEYRATLSPAQRLSDELRRFRWLRRALIALSFLLAVIAIVAAVAARGSIVVAALGAVYICVLLVGRRLIRTRSEKWTPEDEERVHAQLDRVRSTLPQS
jgi:hypothetical protein